MTCESGDLGADRRVDARGGGRRDFLKKAVTLPAALVAARCSAAAPAAETELPQIRLGKHSISRLVCGSNTFNGGSHLSVFVNHELKAYYTPEQMMARLERTSRAHVILRTRPFLCRPPRSRSTRSCRENTRRCWCTRPRVGRSR